MKREVWLDKLKVVATIFVVLLHVNGYAYDTFGNSMSSSQLICMNVIEAAAYCAIHLFVMCGAFIMLEKSPKSKNFIAIYSQTWIVCIIGLVAAIAMELAFSKVQLIQSIFPFIGRAYWFVSDYLVLMFLAPFLNKLIHDLANRELLKLTIIVALIVSILPLLPSEFIWKENCCGITLFIFLYLIVACVKTSKIKINAYIYFSVYIACSMLLVLSYYLLAKLNVASSRYFYSYYNPIVILQALSLFMCFYSQSNRMGVYIPKDKKVLTLSVDNSLLCYLLHMHPIIKNYYSGGVLNFLNIKGIGYAFAIIAFALCVFCGCTFLGIPIKRLSELIVNKTDQYIKRGNNV